MTNSATQSPSSIEELRDSYIQLLKNALTMTLWDARDGSQAQPKGGGLRTRAKRLIKTLVGDEEKDGPATNALREEGRDWPQLAHTMIGLQRMNNLQSCVETVLRDGVPGDLIETGVWRGGACIFMRGILKAYGAKDRHVWVADSFEGLPPPDPANYPADAGDIHHEMQQLAVSLDEVKSNFQRYGLLDDQVHFLKGWFKDTLPAAPFDRLSVLRLDGDMYESTMDGLANLYPKLSRGGYIIIDDFGAVVGCKRAVEDFRAKHHITDPIQRVDWSGVFWRRSD